MNAARFVDSIVGSPLTAPMIKALGQLNRKGVVFAGGGNADGKGGVFSVSASTIRALERKGFGKTRISPDGGMMLVIK